MTKGGHERKKIALVVPGLTLGGGVPAVARFVKDVILGSDRYALKLVSLSMSSRDEASCNLLQPRSWAHGPKTSNGIWEGQPYQHAGAWAGDVEFQRYRSRKILTDALVDCDLIQVVCGSPAWANTVCDLGKPVALQCATRTRIERRCRDSHPAGLSGRWRKVMTEITDRLDDRALRRADAVQVENPWMLDYVRQINSGREIDLRYASPGVDTVLYCPSPMRNLSVAPYILCVARLDDPRKNIGLLLEAYARLPPALIARVRLVLAGASGPPSSFWQRVETLGLRERITCVVQGDRDAVLSLYQSASVFVLPSDEEGFGMVVIEAMACGLPVVSTRSGGPDGIISDGVDGYLVPRDATAAMTDRIARLLSDERLNRAMGQKARVTIEERYAERVAGMAFLDVWDRLLKTKEEI
jgi:glycosyltransferase involved in cell wall biosynthesis